MAMSARIIRGERSGIELDRRGLGELYFESGEKYEDKICQVDALTGQEESFKSVKKRSTNVAIHMRSLGLQSGDVVICCMKNTLDNIIPILSALYLGAKVASLDSSQSVRDCAYCISLVEPKFVFVEEESLQLIERSLIYSKCRPIIIVRGSSTEYKMLSELQQPAPEQDNFRPVAVKDCHGTAFICFSSGTTGLPKGICITHFGLINSRHAFLKMDVINPTVILNFSSFYWISAVTLTTVTFIAGGCRILTSQFNAEETFRIIERYKVTTTFLAPIYTYYLMDVENARKYDTSSLSRMMLGGSSIGDYQLKKIRQIFKHTFVFLAYGSTETSGCVTAFDYTKDKLVVEKYGCSGRCVNDVEVKIVDVETRELLGPNQRGEICARSPYVSPGYYNDPTSIFDQDNFVKTGDIGYYDENECLYVVDRIKEMFKYKSWHVVPSFLEGILEEHPCVKEAAVFGIPHHVVDHLPAACIVFKDGIETDVEEIDKSFTEKVAEWHKLRGGIKIVETLPRTPSGKLQKWKLRELFCNGSECSE